MSYDLSKTASPGSASSAVITPESSPTSSPSTTSPALTKTSSITSLSSPSIDFVVAHHSEKLDWLKEVITHCKIYSKGGPKHAPDFEFEELDNNGREGQTYLYYICKYYDELKDVTIFTQGKAFDHTGMTALEMMEDALGTNVGQVTTFGTQRDLELFDLWDGIPWKNYPCWRKWLGKDLEFIGKKAPKTPAQYFKDFFDNYGHNGPPLSIGFQPGAIFAVRRETIQRHPKKTYQKMLADLFEGEMEQNDPETGHYMERFWLATFSPEEYCCWTEADMSKAERNEQGQLARGKWHKTPPGVEVDEGHTNLSDEE